MTRVTLCGAAFADAAATLGLEAVDDRPDLVLLDVADEEGLRRAAAVDPDVPRVVIAGPEHVAILRALGGARFSLAPSASAAAVGPLVAAARPPQAARPTRTVVVTGVSGGCGRTLLAVNLAVRLATRGPVVLVDLTGSGRAAWWLRVDPSPWSDLEGLTDELTPEHLAVVAADRAGVRAVGGRGAMPSPTLAAAAARAARGLTDLVLIDAPSLADDRTRLISELADRVIVVASDDPASGAALEGVDLADPWIVASRCRAERIAGRAVMRSLPDDPGAVHAAAREGGPVGGALGRAYDDLAEIIAIDAAP